LVVFWLLHGTLDYGPKPDHAKAHQGQGYGSQSFFEPCFDFVFIHKHLSPAENSTGAKACANAPGG
jgi:hypothetical protein